MDSSSLKEAIAILNDCGHQQELIDLLNNQKDKALQEQLAA